MKHMKMIIGIVVLIAAMAVGYCSYQRHQAAANDNVTIQRSNSSCGSCGKHLMTTGLGCVPC